MDSLRIESVDHTKPLGFLVKRYADNVWWNGFVAGSVFTTVVFLSIKAIQR